MSVANDVTGRMAFVLTAKILQCLDESGATQDECRAALLAATALMGETLDAPKPGVIR